VVVGKQKETCLGMFSLKGFSEEIEQQKTETSQVRNL
jgi:hypothetical protein